jgi:hypothetical protein
VVSLLWLHGRSGPCFDPVMADVHDVRRIALALPETHEAEERFVIFVLDRGKPKGFVWAWSERVHDRKPRVPRPDVVAVRVADRSDKEALLASDTAKFFTEPHYRTSQPSSSACP